MPGKSDRAHLASDIQDLLSGAFLKEGCESPSCRNGRNDIDPEFLLEDLQVGPMSATNKRTTRGPNFGRQKITFELPQVAGKMKMKTYVPRAKAALVCKSTAAFTMR